MKNMTSTADTKDLQALMSTISLQKSTMKIKIQNEINQLLDLQSFTIQSLAKLEDKLPSIIDALDKQGLGILNLNYCKTGFDSKLWEDSNCICVNIKAIPISDKFKFIQSSGYNGKGEKKNDVRLKTKAAKLELFIKEKTQFNHISVNEFTLETKPNVSNNSVLIDIYIK